MFPWILCGILIAVILMLLCRVYLLHRSMDEICAQFRERLSTDTNNLVFLPGRDRHAAHLAAEINDQLRLLRRQRRRYLNGDRELKEAVTDISHDLRTPLTAVCGYLDLLKQEEVPEAVERYLEQIENRIEALKMLTEELFRYSVIASVDSSAEGEAGMEAVLNGVLEESLLACYGAFTQKGIEPQICMPPKPVSRSLDAVALSRIFGNILSNVLKYSDGDLKVSLTEEGAVTFVNSAKNLTPVMVDRFFDRFYTVETGRNSTGLGLSIAKLLTERMGGTIRAEYREGRLTVRICFPELTAKDRIGKV